MLTHPSDIGLIAAAYTIWKLVKRTKFVHLDEVPLEAILLDIERNPEQPDPRPKGVLRLVSWMWD